MKRSFNPIMEVIRFDSQDVIVTSGAVDPTYHPIFEKNANSTYVSSGSELYHGGYRDCSLDKWYTFKYDTENPGFKKINEKPIAQCSGFYYAWYKDTENQWFTETNFLKNYTEPYPSD